MKNDLTCGVVRDLLPSYVEGLLGEESRRAVDRHLAGCPGCAALRDGMLVPAPEAETAREVDYLKKVRRRSVRRALLAASCTALVLVGALALKVFVIGTPLQSQSVAADIRVEGAVLRLSLMSVGSGNAFHGWQVETAEGVASVYARDVLVSPLFSNGGKTLEIPLEGLREVWLGGASGQLLWQEGVLIDRETWRLYQARTPYVGDASALGEIGALCVSPQIDGGWTMELSTSQRPYRWTLCFSQGGAALDERMRYVCAPLMLALVENLDEVGWTYPGASPGETVSRTVTLEETDDWLARRQADRGGEDFPGVKEWGGTASGLQRLRDLCGSAAG